MSKFDVNGGHFAPQGYMKVEAGGSHEENPNGGVQVGSDENGVPNLLEEGEPIYDDFVYSDNIYADEEMLKKHSLPDRYRGKLYSEICDDMVNEAEPGDYISNNGLKVMLKRLAAAQEEQKSIKERADIENELSQLSPEELEALETMMAEEQVNPEIQQLPVSPEMIAPEQVVPEQPQMFTEGGDLWNTAYDLLYGKKTANGMNLDLRDTIGEEGDFLTKRFNRNMYDAAVNGLIQPLPAVTTKATTMKNPGLAGAEERSARLASIAEEKSNALKRSTYNELPTWMRYAGIGLDAAMLLNNVAEKPSSYSLPAYEPALPTGSVRTTPLTYQAVDPNMTANSILAQGNATRRAILNSGSGPSTMAGLVAADYNLTNSLGNAINQGWTDAANKRNAIAQANNATELQRATFDYGVSSEQARTINDAQKLRAQWYMLKQQYDNAADTEKAQAISTQMNAIAKALADIGSENFAMNQVNSNDALYFGVTPQGSKYYKGLGFLENYIG